VVQVNQLRNKKIRMKKSKVRELKRNREQENCFKKVTSMILKRRRKASKRKSVLKYCLQTYFKHTISDKWSRKSKSQWS